MVKVAIVKLQPRPGKPDENHIVAVRYIHQAAQAGSDLAVISEYHLDELPQPGGATDGETEQLCAHSQEYLRAYCVLARQCKICIIPGPFAELRHRREGTHGRETEAVVGATYFIGRNGHIFGRYETEIRSPDREFATASAEEPPKRVGLLICWDLVSQEAFRELSSQGTKIIIIPSLWVRDAGTNQSSTPEEIPVESTFVSFEYKNHFAVTYCNAGESIPGKLAGGPYVTVPLIGHAVNVDSNKKSAEPFKRNNSADDREPDYSIHGDIASPGCPAWHSRKHFKSASAVS